MISRAPRPHRKPSAGFTILELVIALTVLVLLVTNVGLVMRTSSDVTEAGIRLEQLENQADLTMDRIALAIMASSSDGIVPAPMAPDSADFLRFSRNVGVEDGEIVWGNEEIIELEQPGQVVWRENKDLPEERRVVWSRWVSDMLEGEQPNAEDDNGNGLEDEAGLAFDMDGRKITVRITLQNVDPEGRVLTKTLETRVTARN